MVAKHLDADPGCIRVCATEEFFPMVNPKAGGKIYHWTLGLGLRLPGRCEGRRCRCSALAHGTESLGGKIDCGLLAA